MCAENTKHSHPGIIQSVLSNRCPRCRKGRLFTSSNPYDFRTTMRMYEYCPVCGQPFELQTGFYFGTGYVSYGLSIMVLAISLVLWHLILGISFRDNSIFWWLGVSSTLLIIIQPLLQRMARSIWIAFFVRYDAGWQKENQS
jgi:uncharacterized protein (DUF983 family)